MKLRHHVLGLSLALLACLAAGCLTTVKTRFEENEDFSSYRRWSWAPRTEQTKQKVDAPHRQDAVGLEARIGRLIEQHLYRNGFIRDDERPEFYVSYQIALTRRKVIVDVPMGMTLVNSYDHTASYWVEGFDREVRVFDDLHLAIGVADPTGEVLWHGSLLEPVADHEPIPARRAVDALLGDLPVSVPEEG